MKVFIKTSQIVAIALSLTLAGNASEVKTELTQPLISYASSDKATGDVKVVYAEIKKAWGMVPEPMKALSLNPKLLRNQWEFYKTIAENKNLDPKMGTMMRYLIAEQHQCKFCIGFNKGMLLNMFKVSLKEIEALEKDPTSAKLEDKQKEMLLFMLKSTSNPHDVNKKDIAKLKKLGSSEKDIMEGAKEAMDMVATSLFIDTFKIL
jgi:uncharacterized peroxidase-related enzyme